MKNLIFAIIGIVALLLTACKDEEKKFNPDAPIYIRGVDALNKNVKYGVDERLTAHKICTLDSISLVSDDGVNGVMPLYCLAYGNLDTINDRIVMTAGNIDVLEDNVFINNPVFSDFFIAKSVHTDHGYVWDTLGYVPNYQREAARAKIAELWEKEDWDAIYEVFQNAFTFIPCTGKEFRELKEQGLN